MDFFPLDRWIIILSKFIKERLALFIKEVYDNHDQICDEVNNSSNIDLQEINMISQPIQETIAISKNNTGKTGIKKPLLEDSINYISGLRPNRPSNKPIMRRPSELHMNQIMRAKNRL